jgi:hypothetical protein
MGPGLHLRVDLRIYGSMNLAVALWMKCDDRRTRENGTQLEQRERERERERKGRGLEI